MHERSVEPSGSTLSTPYSLFSKPEKRLIVLLVSFAGWFSTLSSFIYFPAIPLLAHSLDTSVEHVNLTVTTYLIVSGVAPSVVGNAADLIGRRPILIASLFIYVVSNVILAEQRTFLGLLFLRMLQSAGISGKTRISSLSAPRAFVDWLTDPADCSRAGTFAVAYGAVADIASPAERGSYVGAVSLGTNSAPSIGPILGGVLAARLGWQWIFWVLAILSGTCLLMIALIMPETSRKIVGSGAAKAPKLIRPPISCFKSHCSTEEMRKKPKGRIQYPIPNPFTCVFELHRKDTLLIVLAFGILYMVYSCLQASHSSLVVKVYHLSELQVGLSYLPFGLGCIIAAYLWGHMLDYDFCFTAKLHEISIDRTLDTDLRHFPVEKARLRSFFYPYGTAIVATFGYGWCLQFRVHIAVPLSIQFIIGGTLQCCFTTLNTLLLDLNPENPSTVQATCNLVRCGLAATGIALADVIVERIGIGWYFTLLAIVTTLCALLLITERKNGLSWRQTDRTTISTCWKTQD